MSETRATIFLYAIPMPNSGLSYSKEIAKAIVDRSIDGRLLVYPEEHLGDPSKVIGVAKNAEMVKMKRGGRVDADIVLLNTPEAESHKAYIAEGGRISCWTAITAKVPSKTDGKTWVVMDDDTTIVGVVTMKMESTDTNDTAEEI